MDHPAWLSDLSRYGQKQVLANLQKRFGADKIKSIHLQLDPEARWESSGKSSPEKRKHIHDDQSAK